MKRKDLQEETRFDNEQRKIMAERKRRRKTAASDRAGVGIVICRYGRRNPVDGSREAIPNQGLPIRCIDIGTGGKPRRSLIPATIVNGGIAICDYKC